MLWLEIVYVLLELITSSLIIYSIRLLYLRNKRTGKIKDFNLFITSLLGFAVYIPLTIISFLELELTGIEAVINNIAVYAFLIAEFFILIFAYKMVEENEAILEEAIRVKSEELVAQKIQEREALDKMRRQHVQELIVGARRITGQIQSNSPEFISRMNNLIFLIRENPDLSASYIEELDELFNSSSEALLELTKKTLIGDLRIVLDDLDSIIQNAIKSVQIPENVTVSYRSQFNVIEVDTNKMIQVLENLIENSIEAMPDGGEIDIGVESNNGEIIITVTDSGTGIKREDKDKIFVPFFSTKQDGTGLGLTYCKEVVLAHGGSISFTSEGDSASFIISLPKKVDIKR